jgi:hypothetical protein
VQNIVPGDNVDEDPLGWVAPGPRETASQISSTAIRVFTIVEERAEGAPRMALPCMSMPSRS